MEVAFFCKATVVLSFLSHMCWILMEVWPGFHVPNKKPEVNSTTGTNSELRFQPLGSWSGCPDNLRMQVVAGRIKSLEYLFWWFWDLPWGCPGAFFKTQIDEVFFHLKSKTGVCFLLFFPGKKDDISQSGVVFFFEWVVVVFVVFPWQRPYPKTPWKCSCLDI